MPESKPNPNKGPWFKVTNHCGRSIFARNFTYSLPKKDKPGKWMHTIGALMMCVKGFHVTKNPEMWKPYRCHLYVVEAKGFVEHTYGKSLCRSMRFIKRIRWTDLPKKYRD